MWWLDYLHLYFSAFQRKMLCKFLFLINILVSKLKFCFIIFTTLRTACVFFFYSNSISLNYTRCHGQVQWTVPQLSIIIIYNYTWSILIQWVRDILLGDDLVYTIDAYFLIVINLITRTMDFSKCEQKLKMCGTMHMLTVCTSEQFTCLRVNKCLPKSAVCNGVNDCGDWSDEMNCGEFG